MTKKCNFNGVIKQGSANLSKSKEKPGKLVE